MKLLFDQKLSHRLPGLLSDLFPASTQARLVGLDRATDADLWEYASREGFAIASRDVDLAEMATLLGAPPLVIWLRGGNSSTASVEAALRLRQVEILEAEADRSSVVEVWW